MYHIPVMLKECIEGLQIIPDGVYVDVTFGGGGHSKAMLEKLNENGRLYAFDQDEDAKENVLADKRFTLIQANFRHITRFLKVFGVTKVNGILADFGISSHQIDEPQRGFSTRFNAELDMRMNAQEGQSARDVVNHYSVQRLQAIFSEYGEIQNSKTLALAIESYRTDKEIETTDELKEICRKVSKGKEVKYLSQVFQAIRIEVNDELNALQDFLVQAKDLLLPGGRLVIMSYHSLEDRPVKNYMKMGVFEGEPEKDVFGNYKHDLTVISKKPIEATEEEIKMNPRARSAKLRIAQKI